MGERIETGLAEMTPAQMLAVHDRFMSGGPITDSEDALARSISLAASFGAEAYARHAGCDGGATHAMLRSFLTALVDPMHPDLDYLRIDPASGPAARTGGDNG